MNILKFNFKQTTFKIKGKEYKIKPQYVDYILSFIVNRMINDSELKNGYVDIPSITFRKLYDKYWIYIGYLIDIEVLERKPYSVKNHVCYGYRFCYQFIRDLQITEVVLNNTSERCTDCKEIPVEDQALVNYKTIQRLKSDFLTAEIDTTNIDRVRIEYTAYVDSKKFFYNVIQLNKWKTGSDHIHFEWKSNRLYNNFSFLSSHYRKNNVKLNGESIVEYDISSSFPLMLAILCLKVNPDIANDHDFKKYCTSIKQKTFYEDLTKSLNLTKDCDKTKCKVDKYGNQIGHREFTKDVTKRLFQIFINGDNSRVPFIEGFSNSFIKEQFGLKYPCINEIITDIKSNNDKIYYKLSKIESEFIFEIIEEVYDKIPGIKILTCHDAIYVPINYSERVEDIWKSHMQDLYDKLPDTIEKSTFDSKLYEGIGIYEDKDSKIAKKKYCGLYREEDFDFFNEIEDEEEDNVW